MAKMKFDVVYLKDLVKRLDGATLRDVAGLGLKIQGWEWCDMEELVDLVVEHVTYKEICDLYCRWNDDGLVDEQMVELVAEDGLEFEIVSSVSERCKIKTRSEGEEYAALLGNFLNNIRLRTNNGWTPDELLANSSVQNANAPFVRTHPTVGRNAPCPSGSGKKYKKCCGKL